MANSSFRKWKIAGVIVIGVAIAGMFGWFSYRRSEATDEIASRPAIWPASLVACRCESLK